MVSTLDLLLALLQGSLAQEPLAAFLLEPGNLEVLLALLVRPKSLPLLPDRVCKVHPAHPHRWHPIRRGCCLGSGRGALQAWGQWMKLPSQAPLGAARLCGDFPSYSKDTPP